MGKVVIVDQNDLPIGLKERSLLTPDDIYRLSIIWITNSRGEILMSQRAYVKATLPGLWSAAAGGIVDEGEEYTDNIIKETEEEIGLRLDPTKLMQGEKLKWSEPSPCFIQWFSYVADVSLDELTLKRDEVEAVRWYTKDELKKELAENPSKFTTLSKYWSSKFL